MPRRLIFLPMFILLLIPEICQSQQNRWENLAQLKAGQKLNVVDRHHKTVSGEFLRFSDTDLTLHVKGQETKISRDEVGRITSRGQHRKRNALIGLLVGAGVGGGMGAGIMEREPGYGGAVAGTAVGFAAIGAGVGALIPGSKIVYRSEEDNASTRKPAEALVRAFPAD